MDREIRNKLRALTIKSENFLDGNEKLKKLSQVSDKYNTYVRKERVTDLFTYLVFRRVFSQGKWTWALR